MAKVCSLSTGKQALGGLPRSSVVRITDCSNITSAVYRGCKASTQTQIKCKPCSACMCAGFFCAFFSLGYPFYTPQAVSMLTSEINLSEGPKTQIVEKNNF